MGLKLNCTDVFDDNLILRNAVKKEEYQPLHYKNKFCILEEEMFMAKIEAMDSWILRKVNKKFKDQISKIK